MRSIKYAEYDLRKDVNKLNNYTQHSTDNPPLDVLKSTIQMKDQLNKHYDRYKKSEQDSKRNLDKHTFLLLFLLEERIKNQQYSTVSQKDSEVSKLLLKLLCMLLGVDE